MAEAVEKDGDEMSCAVCMDKLSDAKYLKCFHSFCTRCLEHCVRNLKVSCPLCREATNVSKGIESLLPNLGASRRMKEAQVRETIETKIQDGGCQCGSCKELGVVCLAKSYCVDCKLLICEACVNAHKLLKLTRSHRIISVLEFQNSARFLDGDKLRDDDAYEKRCEKHGAPLTMFCRPCQLSTCPQCASLDHHSELGKHECVNMSDIGDEMIVELRQSLGKIDPNNFDRVAESYKRRLKNVAEKAQELKSKINEAAQNEVACLYARIEERRVDLNARVLEVEKASSRRAAQILSGIKRLRARAEKLNSYADELLKTANPLDIMAAKDTLTDHLKDIRAEMRKLTSDDSDFDDLNGYTFTATDWMASGYEPGVGRLESCDQKEDQGEPSQTGRFKRRMSARPLRSPPRPHSTLPHISSTHSLVH